MVLMAPLLYRCSQVLLSPVQTARMFWLVPVASQLRMVQPAAGVKSEMALAEPFYKQIYCLMIPPAEEAQQMLTR